MAPGQGETELVYAKLELPATRPNELWSWDITKPKGPAMWTCYYLYVILDVFSRYVVGWTVVPRESAQLASKRVSETMRKQEVNPNILTIHADRGSSMKSKCAAMLLSDLGFAKDDLDLALVAAERCRCICRKLCSDRIYSHL